MSQPTLPRAQWLLLFTTTSTIIIIIAVAMDSHEMERWTNFRRRHSLKWCGPLFDVTKLISNLPFLIVSSGSKGKHLNNAMHMNRRTDGWMGGRMHAPSLPPSHPPSALREKRKNLWEVTAAKCTNYQPSIVTCRNSKPFVPNAIRPRASLSDSLS